MRYFTWKLNWDSGEGTDPTSGVNSHAVRVEPTFATGDVRDSGTLIYAVLERGNLEVPSLSEWQVTETTVEAMLAAALVVNPEATLVDGRIRFPMMEELK